jgi:hypothetical protein
MITLANPVAALAVDVITFGLFDKDAAGEWHFVETGVIQNSEAQRYGWGAYFGKRRPTVHVREEFDLPRPIPLTTVPDASAGVRYSADRRRVTIEGDMSVSLDGFVSRFWYGDPPGAYELRVFIDNKLLGRFPFVVREQMATTHLAEQANGSRTEQPAPSQWMMLLLPLAALDAVTHAGNNLLATRVGDISLGQILAGMTLGAMLMGLWLESRR